MVPLFTVLSYLASPGLHQKDRQCRAMPLHLDGSAWTSSLLRAVVTLSVARYACLWWSSCTTWLPPVVPSLELTAVRFSCPVSRGSADGSLSWRLLEASSTSVSVSLRAPQEHCAGRARLPSVSAPSLRSSLPSGAWGHFCPEHPTCKRLSLLITSPGLVFL